MQVANRDAFRSARLVYRAVQPSDVDFIDKEMNADAEIFTLSDPGVVRPQRRKAAEGIVEALEKAVLGVIICLPGGEAEDAGEATGDEKAKGEAAKSSEPKPIGLIHLTASSPEMAHHRNTNLGFGLTRPYWGKGYGQEAMEWLLEWAFHRANMHRVGLATAGFNHRAQKLYEKCGFVEEGVTRDAVWVEGRYWDAKRYGILEDEWRAKYGKKFDVSRR
jgi:RimJ/RimL family protein N-acetyltransferase